MRSKQIIPGLKNSQPIRVIIDGTGFPPITIKDVDSMPFVSQRIAVHSVLSSMAARGLRGLATTQRVYTERQVTEEYQVQVDLV